MSEGCVVCIECTTFLLIQANRSGDRLLLFGKLACVPNFNTESVATTQALRMHSSIESAG